MRDQNESFRHSDIDKHFHTRDLSLSQPIRAILAAPVLHIPKMDIWRTFATILVEFLEQNRNHFRGRLEPTYGLNNRG